MAARSTLRERNNWHIHQLMLRGDHDECLTLIENELEACNGLCEYPIFVKGLILRHRGKIKESLQLFQAATCLSPKSVVNLKQVARSLYLLARYRQALEVLEEARKCLGGRGSDWELEHFRGVCLSRMGDMDGAIEAFVAATDIQRQEDTYLELSRAFEAKGDMDSAEECLQEAVEESPDSAMLLTALGTLMLRRGNSVGAFEHLGNALARDPRNSTAILAAGSVLQDHDDADVALSKYRVAAVTDPHSPELWNNVGMAFHASGKLVAAVACLKRANYLAPFEWIISFNLGVVYLATGQWASAFTALSASINLKPGQSKAYAHLAIALHRLGDPVNAKAAYRKALRIDEKDIVTLTNYTLFLCDIAEKEEAKSMLEKVKHRMETLSEDERSHIDLDVPRRIRALNRALED